MLDASVALKWVLPGEPYEEKANMVRDDLLVGTSRMCAPSLMMHEVANSLWKATKQRRLLPTDAHEALKNLNDAQIQLFELNSAEIYSELIIANKLDIACYDAAYLALSEKMKAQVITADDKLYEKSKNRFRVLHLRDYV